MRSQLTATIVSQAQAILLLNFRVAETTGVHHHAQLFILYFWWRQGFTILPRLELLTSGDQTTSASQSARITGMSHHPQPNVGY